MTQKSIALLTDTGFIAVTGPEAGVFLQSQLSADIDALDVETTVLTGWHDPRGRALACPRVIARPNGYWLALPREMVEPTLTGLQRFVFRTRVQLEDATSRVAAAAVIDKKGHRFAVYALLPGLAERVAAHQAAGDPVITPDEWALLDIRAGLPQVYTQTRGEFTGQMLNLDRTDGISFSKGCYPGQEIIARTHHRGRAKRRMQHYASTAAPPEPGTALTDRSGRAAGKVVRSAPTDNGSESLIVASVDNPPTLYDADGTEYHPITS